MPRMRWNPTRKWYLWNMASKQQYRFGNTVLGVLSPEPLTVNDQITHFEVPAETIPDYTFYLRVGETVPPAARDVGYFHLKRTGNDVHVYLGEGYRPGSMSMAHFLGQAQVYGLLLEKGAFVLHASYVLVNGRALLFSAPSGTGKSTQAHFWRDERGARIVNEDRVVIFPKDGIYYATGCWAMGSAKVTDSVEAPIEALILLSQGSENSVRPIRPLQAIQWVVEQCSYDPKDPVQKCHVLETVCNALSSLRILSYECINHPSSVDELEKYL